MTFSGKKAEGRGIPGILLGFLGVTLVVFSHGTSQANASCHLACRRDHAWLARQRSRVPHLLHAAGPRLPTRVVSVTYFGPVWGLFWGKLAHEPIAPAEYVRVAIVIAGLVLLSRTSNSASQSEPSPKASEISKYVGAKLT